ncbi:MAG TPA: hypothetical protein VJ783_07495, partial [Pirellulales bacterium]|nr:hypothetical protein [Pirellulales bacterium]
MFSRKWLLAIALAAWCCAAAAVLRADDGTSDADAKGRATIDLEEITRRLTQWRASFHNLRLVWELRSLPKTKEAVVEWPPPPDPTTSSLFSRREWIWGAEGLELLEERSFFYPDGGSEMHSIEAFNVPKDLVFLANFQQPPRGAEKLVKLVLDGSTDGKPPSEKMRTPLQSLYWPDRAAWLPEILAHGDWKVDKIEDVGGDPCARLAAEQPYSVQGVGLGDLWLDLNHDCLVRRHRRRGTGTVLGDDFIVDEYQQLEGGVWFPKRGRMQFAGSPYDNELFVVTDAA